MGTSFLQWKGHFFHSCIQTWKHFKTDFVIIYELCRTKDVDWMPFFSQRLVDDFASHLRLYRRAREHANVPPTDGKTYLSSKYSTTKPALRKIFKNENFKQLIHFEVVLIINQNFSIVFETSIYLYCAYLQIIKTQSRKMRDIWNMILDLSIFSVYGLGSACPLPHLHVFWIFLYTHTWSD